MPLQAADATGSVTASISAMTTLGENRRSAETDGQGGFNLACCLDGVVIGTCGPTEIQPPALEIHQVNSIGANQPWSPVVPPTPVLEVPVCLASHGTVVLGRRDGSCPVSLLFSTGLRSLILLSVPQKRFCRSRIAVLVQSLPLACSVFAQCFASIAYRIPRPCFSHRRPRCFHSLPFRFRSFSALLQRSRLPSHGLSLALQQALLPTLEKS